MRYDIFLEFTEGFRLDSFSKGVLDVDVLGYLTQQINAPIYSINAQRGKSRELDKFTVGTCVITFDNRDRMFDPSKNNVPGSIGVYPGRRISVKMFDTNLNVYVRDIFNGYTNEWTYDYQLGGEATATVSCVDAFSILSNKEIIDGIVCPAETSGLRILRILSNGQVNFPLTDVNIDPGNTVLAAETVTGNALAYLQQVELTEQGQLFVDGFGKLRFLQRQIAYSGSLNFNNYSEMDMNFHNIDLAYSNDTLINYVEVTSPVGTAVAANNNSISTYQVSSQQFSTLHNNATELDLFAKYIVEEFGNPEYRVNSLTWNVETPLFPRGGTNPIYGWYMLNRYLQATDLGVIARPKFYPGSVYPPSLNDVIQPGDAWISGVKHDITTSRHDITLNFVKAVGLFSFRLDDRSFGLLDVNTLGY